MKNRDTNMGQLRNNHFSATSWDNLPYKEWKKAMNEFLKYSAKILKEGGSMIMFMSLIKTETIITLLLRNTVFIIRQLGYGTKKTQCLGI
jgi:hypothetical protein